jgi:hypothetical protein
MGHDLGDAAADADDYEWVNDWLTPAGAEAPYAALEPAEILSQDIAEIRSVQPERAVAAGEGIVVAFAPKIFAEGHPEGAEQEPANRAPADLLSLDIVDIERARDALNAERLFVLAAPAGKKKSVTQAFTLVPSRTADTVPVFVGGVLALMMLTVFGAAAMVSKFAR